MTASINGDWSLKRLLVEKIGSGPKTAADLTYDQAREGFARVLDGDPDRATVAAFLLANRWKVSTPTELAGFIDAVRSRSVNTASPAVDPVDCGANYDGKTDTVVLGVAAGLVAAAAGTPVVTHAGPPLPGKEGATYRDVLAELGVATDITPAASARMTDEVGFGFYNQTQFSPALDDIRDLRATIGVRTSINTVETLANPANASVHLGSFYHRTYGEKVASAVRESRTLPTEEVLMVTGLEGYDDIRPGTVPVAEWTGGESITERQAFDSPPEFDREALSADDVREASARVTESVLSNDRDGPLVEAVLVNAGARIYAGGNADTIPAGVEQARTALHSGEATARLGALRSFSP